MIRARIGPVASATAASPYSRRMDVTTTERAQVIMTRAAWQQILKRQSEERDILKANHEEEREIFYRSNKSIMDLDAGTA
jgi:hypothetical protein